MFDVVVFPSIDRAWCSVREVIEIDGALRGAGLDTVFLREGVDTSTLTGELFRSFTQRRRRRTPPGLRASRQLGFMRV